MLFIEFEGKDYHNIHFNSLQMCLEYVKNALELDLHDISHIRIYELWQEEPNDDTIYKMEILCIDVTRFRRVWRKTHG